MFFNYLFLFDFIFIFLINLFYNKNQYLLIYIKKSNNQIIIILLNKIFTPNKCSIDLGSNYYINESDVKEEKRRDEASLKELRILKHHVKLAIMEGENRFKNIKKYNASVISEMIDEKTLIKLDEECRNNNIGFIYYCALGKIL